MKNILVSMLVNIGDVIMMTSVLDLIKRERPGTRLTALARPEAAELLRGNPCLDGAIIYPYRSGSFFHGLGGLLKELRRGGFDGFLSLDRRPRGAVAAALAGLGERLGPDLLFAGSKPEFWTRFLFTKEARLTPAECRGNLVEMFHLVARRAMGLTGTGRITLPPVAPERRAWAARLFAPARGPVAGLCVRTNDPGKMWPADRFAALMRRLRERYNAFMYVTGGPGDREYVEALLAQAAPATALNLAGQTSLMDITALAGQADLGVTLDNGAAHLMAASGLKKLVCLMVATEPAILAGSLTGAKLVKFPPRQGPWPAETLGADVDAAWGAITGLME